MSASSTSNSTVACDPDDALLDTQVKLIKLVAYGYVSPVIIGVGIFGDIMTLVVLSHSSLRRASVVYAYLLYLAFTDLLTLLSVIPMILWLIGIKVFTRSAAFYYAHFGFPLVNALMGSSVFIVGALTLSQYIAICYPFHATTFRSKRACNYLVATAYAISFIANAPWCVKHMVAMNNASGCANQSNIFVTPITDAPSKFSTSLINHPNERLPRDDDGIATPTLPDSDFVGASSAAQARNATHCDLRRQLEALKRSAQARSDWSCRYEAVENKQVAGMDWFIAYEWIRELLLRFVPFVLVAFCNIRILTTYRTMRKHRFTVISSQQRISMRHKTNLEERRLKTTQVIIIAIFFVCTIPAAFLTILIKEHWEYSVHLQTFRAVANVLEFTKFALNFYFYCMINPDIRNLCKRRLCCQPDQDIINSKFPFQTTSCLAASVRMSQQRSTISGRRNAAYAQPPQTATRQLRRLISNSTSAIKQKSRGEDATVSAKRRRITSAGKAEEVSRNNSNDCVSPIIPPGGRVDQSGAVACEVEHTHGQTKLLEANSEIPQDNVDEGATLLFACTTRVESSCRAANGADAKCKARSTLSMPSIASANGNALRFPSLERWSENGTVGNNRRSP